MSCPHRTCHLNFFAGVGYGMDVAYTFRELPSVGVVTKEAK